MLSFLLGLLFQGRIIEIASRMRIDGSITKNVPIIISPFALYTKQM